MHGSSGQQPAELASLLHPEPSASAEALPPSPPPAHRQIWRPSAPAQHLSAPARPCCLRSGKNRAARPWAGACGATHRWMDTPAACRPSLAGQMPTSGPAGAGGCCHPANTPAQASRMNRDLAALAYPLPQLLPHTLHSLIRELWAPPKPTQRPSLTVNDVPKMHHKRQRRRGVPEHLQRSRQLGRRQAVALHARQVAGAVGLVRVLWQGGRGGTKVVYNLDSLL